LALDGCLTILGELDGKEDQVKRMILATADELVLKKRLNTALNPPSRKESGYEKKWRKKREAREKQEESKRKIGFEKIANIYKEKLKTSGPAMTLVLFSIFTSL